MHILVTNDDGFDSKNLRILVEACCHRGHRVTVVAPHAQQSAKSHAFTLSVPLLVHEAQMPGAVSAYRVEGTPVDACRIGMLGLSNEKIDLVLSGINEGYNVGLATYVSGTCGAAREAAFQGYKAMAVSMEKETPAETALHFADYAVRIGEKLVVTDVPMQSVLNLNVPPIPSSEVRGGIVCGLSRNVYKDGYERRISPRGQLYFWLKGEEADEHPTPDSDVDYLKRGYLTCTFLTPEGCSQEAYQDFPLPWSL